MMAEPEKKNWLAKLERVAGRRRDRGKDKRRLVHSCPSRALLPMPNRLARERREGVKDFDSIIS